MAGENNARLNWLTGAYEKSPEIQQLREAARRDYIRHLGTIITVAGDVNSATIGREGVIALRNRFSDQPRKANYVLQVLSLLLTGRSNKDYFRRTRCLAPKN